MGGGGGWGCVSWRARVLAGVLVAAATAESQAVDRERCHSTPAGTAAVQAVLDGRTLRLADGRQVRLIGLEVPERHDRAQAARGALAALVEGREVALGRLREEADRNGRLPALVFPAPAGSGPSIQRTLVTQGHVWVASRVGDIACALQLLEAERAARAAGLGLWADTDYLIRKAENPGEIPAGRGTFVVVEGQVLSVRESGGTIYMNFGRRWSEDFTVTILKRNERIFGSAGMDLKRLAGRRVRVRGFAEERGGPWIEATRPEQIEIAERD
jgi:endonuclease YncB( thermonuclease family)